MFICVGFTAIISLYICLVYKPVNKNSFFDRSFHLSLFALAVITAMVIFTFGLTVCILKWYCIANNSKSAVAKETVNCYTKERERNTQR
jgi:multisubunit Na+/H+ antiporter MnhB subunit